MRIILIICLTISQLYISAQTGQTFIQKALGGTSSEKFQTFQHTSDGGYIIAGATMSKDGNVVGLKGGIDIWVVKLNDNLTINWQLCIGTRSDEEGGIIRETAEGDFFVFGNTLNKQGVRDMLLTKIYGNGSLKGKVAWQKLYGGTGDDRAGAIEVLAGGAIMLAGQSNSTNGDIIGNHGNYDVWVAVLSSTGNINWQRSVGGTGAEYLRSAEMTNDGGIIISSRTTSPDLPGYKGNSDALIAKLHHDPTKEWKIVMGSSGAEEVMFSKEKQDGKIIFAISPYRNDLDFPSPTVSRIWAVQFGEDGIVEWKKDYGASPGFIRDLQITSSGFILMAEYNDLDLINVDNAGDLIWRKSYGGNGLETALLTRQTSDGGFVIFGSTYSTDILNSHVTSSQSPADVYVVKTDVNGEIEWEQAFGGSGIESEIGNGPSKNMLALDPIEYNILGFYSYHRTLIDENGNIYFAVNTTSNDGDVTGFHLPRRGTANDIWFVKILTSGNQVTSRKILSNEDATISCVHKFYPNPTNGLSTLAFTLKNSDHTTIEVYNITGQKLSTVFNGKTIAGMSYNVRFDAAQLKPGNYFYIIRSGKESYSGKILIQ